MSVPFFACRGLASGDGARTCEGDRSHVLTSFPFYFSGRTNHTASTSGWWVVVACRGASNAVRFSSMFGRQPAVAFYTIEEFAQKERFGVNCAFSANLSTALHSLRPDRSLRSKLARPLDVSPSYLQSKRWSGHPVLRQEIPSGRGQRAFGSLEPRVMRSFLRYQSEGVRHKEKGREVGLLNGKERISSFHCGIGQHFNLTDEITYSPP